MAEILRSVATVHDVIEGLRTLPSNSERGTAFEQLMVRYFQLDPLLASKYDAVWRWMDWPDRQGKPDTGIDLVARDRLTAELTAVQCKFYEPSHWLAKGDIDSFFTASGKHPFVNRIIISTTSHWGKNAEDALAGQQIPVERINLDDIAGSPINWDIAWPNKKLTVTITPATRHEPMPHQAKAIADVFDGFKTHDRGKLIMACGTGKTFTSLKIAERLASEQGGSATVLFLVPSISLLAQSLREWTAQTQLDMRSFAVCSDAKVSRVIEDINSHDLMLPATTDPASLIRQMALLRRAAGLTVVFSTYQSLPVVADSQPMGIDPFDLVICDEAHRTTGVTLLDSAESNFVRIHDNTYLKARKRLYMTATPRIFDEKTRAKAEEYSAVVTSMDEEADYGPEFHRLSFGQAVDRGLLSDYKVLVLTVDEEYIARPLQEQIVDANHEINLDDATKIVGCWNGLAKRAGQDMHGEGFSPDSVPMKRAVAFLRDIKTSKKLEATFEQVVDAYDGGDGDALSCTVHHVDGTFNALDRNRELTWLKSPVPDGECRILSNARCLSEGVDVPALDAVMFLNPRNSIVDVVQSVGRVMRKARDKDYGYIILPIGVPSGMAPDKALADNERFKVVWQVLNALRAHDDRFNAIVNSIELNKGEAGKNDDKILGGHIGPTSETVGEDGKGLDGKDSSAAAVQQVLQAPLFALSDWRDAIYARIVKNVGTRAYWEDWAKDVAQVAEAQQIRIHAAVHGANPGIRQAFTNFVTGLRHTLNDSITETDAVSMLSQHLITKPIFDALFEDYSFAAHNPVSQVMQAMIDALSGQGLDAELGKLESFYDSVRMRAEGVASASGKQQIMHDLYERFFKLAFPKQAEAFGIVYTPVPIVDFLLRAANDVLNMEFGKSLSDKGVHILDGFTGTGTFIVRLLQSGIIRPEDLARKYASELHANEIMLLAYYIAAVNIEATYHALVDNSYKPFGGIILTDTFQISEAGDRADTSLLPVNNDRIEKQLASPITVITSNPPYSVGQLSENDNNKNLKYPTLDGRIADTYAARSAGNLKKGLYDSYIRAIRWASDRLGSQGVVAYVTNGGWIESTSADGMRLSLEDEFSSIYVYNLRGNQRTAGEESRKEGGKVFGSGSRNTVAMLIAVKNPDQPGPCQIHYRDIGDYLTREQKLEIVEEGQLLAIDWQMIVPNKAGDWIGQRSEDFASFTPVAVKDSQQGGIFSSYSLGVSTNRDAWVYRFDRLGLEASVRQLIGQFNHEADRYTKESVQIPSSLLGDWVDNDSKKISWSASLLPKVARGRRLRFNPDHSRTATYRPFVKTCSYFDPDLNDRVGRMPTIFPTAETSNVAFYTPTAGSSAPPFLVLATTVLPDLGSAGISGVNVFPRWTYETLVGDADQPSLLSEGTAPGGSSYRRVDNISVAVWSEYKASFGEQVTKDDIFYYVYGVLHSEQYRVTFASDLKKMLPRIPKASSREDFEAFVSAGRRLVELHVGYESVEAYPLVETVNPAIDDLHTFRVTKMRFRSKTDRSTILFNGHVTLSAIPEEAYRYKLGARSAIEWLVERYQVKVDKPSGIVNDPNAWCLEVNDPRYIVDLVKRIVTVSLETMKIVDCLPSLPI